MKCPRCDTDLVETNIHELAITCNAHVCPDCKGTWTGKEQLQEIESKVEPRIFEFRRVPSAQTQMESLKCPQCEGQVMEKVESSRDRKVILDVCPGCGNIWLDAGEISAIQQDSLLVLLTDAFRWNRKD